MTLKTIVFFLLLIQISSAQFGEIASLATSLLGGALGNGAGLGALAGAGAAGAGAAGQAGGAIAQIGQLYQLAQGALQLTGTGVGVLNQASEGNWFPAVLEQTAKNSQAFMKANREVNFGSLGATVGKTGGSSSVGPEFGTNFPAPDIDDYDETAEIPGITKDKQPPKVPDGLVDIDKNDYEEETLSTTTTLSTTQPTAAKNIKSQQITEKEKISETISQPTRKISIQLPGNSEVDESQEEIDYEDLIDKQQRNSEKKTETPSQSIGTNKLENNVITFGTKTQPLIPNLDKLLEVLQKSNLSEVEINEIVKQVEGNKNPEKPVNYEFNAAVQNIPEKKNAIRKRVTDASRIISTSFDNENRAQNYTRRHNSFDSSYGVHLKTPTTNEARQISSYSHRINQVQNNQHYNGVTQPTGHHYLKKDNKLGVNEINKKSGTVNVTEPISPNALQMATDKNDRVVHYYDNGHTIVQQLVPRKIAAMGSFPLHGPFQLHSTGIERSAAYFQTQKALEYKYLHPRQIAVTIDSTSAKHRQFDMTVHPKVFESVVTATGRQAHAIKTLQIPVRSTFSGKPELFIQTTTNPPKKRMSGHVSSSRVSGHRKILETRTTSQPRVTGAAFVRN